MCIFRARILENVAIGVHINVKYLTVDCSPQDPSRKLGKTCVKFITQE
jgi:hypothetical protein